MKPEIELNKKTYPLYVGSEDGKGSSVLLEARVYSEMYGLSNIVWSIKDNLIVDFDNKERGTARIRAKRTGLTTVVARLPDGERAECVLTVIDNYTRFTVLEIELNTKELRLCEGTSARLIPIFYPKDIYQNGMLNTSLTWESGDESIALVSNGNVTAVNCGETDIIVRSVDNGRSVICRVKVTDDDANNGDCVTVAADTIELFVGDFLNLSEKIFSRTAWQSDNRYIVSVDENGCVTACSPSLKREVDETGMNVKEIPETVWIYATNINGGSVVKFPVIVKSLPVPIHEISIWPSELFLTAGKSKNVTAAVNATGLLNASIVWESGDEEILSAARADDTVYGTAQATVSANKPGSTVVTASVGNMKAYCKVNICEDEFKISSIKMEQRKEIEIDQVFKFKPLITENAHNKKLHWLINDSETATLDREGTVQGYRAGEAKVYAIADDSLSPEQRDAIKKYSGGDLQIILANAVYAKCLLSVKDENKTLRNLHVVNESVTDNSILLLWNRASLLDIGTFDRYIIFCGESQIVETKKLGYRAENLKPRTEYQFHVAAVDKDGNVLHKSSVSAVTKEKSTVINVLDYGAAGDGKSMDTFFIQKAINACPKNGTVLLPENHIFVSGALFLKSNMTFQVDGILFGSNDPKDYPRVITKWEGWRKLEQPAESWENSSNIKSSLHTPVTVNHRPHASLLNAGVYNEGENGLNGPYNVENLTVCGKGQINANGFTLAYNEGPNANTGKVASRPYPVKDATSRGSAIRVHNGKNVYMKDIQVAYAPGWTVHTIFCEHITFDGMEIVSQGDGDCGQGADLLHCGHIFNGDGIDPESCIHVNIFDTLFTTGDDAVAIKSGRNKEGNELDKPNAYIRVTDSASVWSLGGFGTGSETAAGSHDLLFQNLFIKDIFISGIWIKTCPPRGGVTENIQVRDVTADGCNSPAWVFNNYSGNKPQVNPSTRPTIVRNLVFENVHGNANNEMGFRLEGTPDCVIQNVILRGISNGGRENQINYCENLKEIN